MRYEPRRSKGESQNRLQNEPALQRDRFVGAGGHARDRSDLRDIVYQRLQQEDGSNSCTDIAGLLGAEEPVMIDAFFVWSPTLKRAGDAPQHEGL